MLMVVLFPAPLGPRKEKISPLRTLKLMPHRLNAVERVFEVSHLDDVILPIGRHPGLLPARAVPSCAVFSYFPFPSGMQRSPRSQRFVFPPNSVRQMPPATPDGPARIDILKYRNHPIPSPATMCGCSLLTCTSGPGIPARKERRLPLLVLAALVLAAAITPPAAAPASTDRLRWTSSLRCGSIPDLQQ